MKWEFIEREGWEMHECRLPTVLLRVSRVERTPSRPWIASFFTESTAWDAGESHDLAKAKRLAMRLAQKVLLRDVSKIARARNGRV